MSHRLINIIFPTAQYVTGFRCTRIHNGRTVSFCLELIVLICKPAMFASLICQVFGRSQVPSGPDLIPEAVKKPQTPSTPPPNFPKPSTPSGPDLKPATPPATQAKVHPLLGPLSYCAYSRARHFLCLGGKYDIPVACGDYAMSSWAAVCSSQSCEEGGVGMLLFLWKVQ